MNQNPLLTILEIVLLFNVFMINNSAITHWRGEGKKKKNISRENTTKTLAIVTRKMLFQ